MYLNQSVSPCYKLMTPKTQEKEGEEVKKIMEEKEEMHH